MPFRADAGTYVLLIDSVRPEPILVGRLGTMRVQPGTYAYVGSAFGPGGVKARVERHLRGTSSPHWHIDYLRPQGRVHSVWHTYDAVRRECAWAEALRSMPAATTPLDGFGASDCDCLAHLVHTRNQPSLALFRDRLLTATEAHAPIHVTSTKARPRVG